jgi:hypothetical protein
VGDSPIPRVNFIEQNPKTAIFHDVVRIAFCVNTEQKAIDAEEKLQEALSTLHRAMAAATQTVPKHISCRIPA